MLTNATSIQLIKEEQRFNPAYYNFFHKKQKLLTSSNIPFKRLASPGLTKLITDGEHQAIELFEEPDQTPIRYLYVHNVKEGFIDFQDSLYITPRDHKRLKRSQLNPGDVILTVVGSIGKAAMVTSALGEANIPRNIAKIVTDPAVLLPEYLTCFFLSRFGREQSLYTSGGNIQGLLSLGKLASLSIPVPSIPTQQEFKEIYASALELEHKSLGMIQQAQEKLRSYLQLPEEKDTLTYTVQSDTVLKSSLWTPQSQRPKYTNAVSFLKNHFQYEKLGTMVDIQKGNEIGSENYVNFFASRGDEVPFIRTSDFSNFEIDQYGDFVVPTEVAQLYNQDLAPGDILYSNDGKIGEIAVLTTQDSCIIQSHIRKLRIRQGRKENPYYIFLMLSLPEVGGYQAKQATVIQSTIPTLANRLSQFVIPLLPAHQQEELGKIVEEAYVLKGRKKQLIKTVREKMNSYLGYPM